MFRARSDVLAGTSATSLVSRRSLCVWVCLDQASLVNPSKKVNLGVQGAKCAGEGEIRAPAARRWRKSLAKRQPVAPETLVVSLQYKGSRRNPVELERVERGAA